MVGRGGFGLMDAQQLEVVLAPRYERDLAVGKKRNLRAVGGMDGIAGLAVANRLLDVGDILHAEERQLFRRQVSDSFALVHRSLSTVPEARSCASARAPLGERWESPVISPPVISRPVISPPAICIGRPRLSPSGRTKSMWRSPLSSRAPRTSMPSARTKDRWNWRAAMPRCR